MPDPPRDWQGFVRRELPDLQVAPERFEEIVTELAEHLASAYREARARGGDEDEALHAVRAQIGSWQEIGTGIQAAETSALERGVARGDAWSERFTAAPSGIGRRLAEIWQDLRFALRRGGSCRQTLDQRGMGAPATHQAEHQPADPQSPQHGRRDHARPEAVERAHVSKRQQRERPPDQRAQDQQTDRADHGGAQQPLE